MGEYARLNQMLRDHESQIEALKTKLNDITDENERENILEQIYDLEVGKGEIEGGLLEMAEVDGLDDKYEAFDY